VQQSDNKSKGINKLSILTVSAVPVYLICGDGCDRLFFGHGYYCSQGQIYWLGQLKEVVVFYG
jgi:hypothetical protein